MLCSKKLLIHNILEERITQLELKNKQLLEKINLLEENNNKLSERINLLENLLKETTAALNNLTELVKQKMPSQIVSTVASAATAVGMTLLSQSGVTLPIAIIQKLTGN